MERVRNVSHLVKLSVIQVFQRWFLGMFLVLGLDKAVCLYRYLFLGPAAGGSLVHDCTKNTTRNATNDFLGNEDTPENNVSVAQIDRRCHIQMIDFFLASRLGLI